MASVDKRGDTYRIRVSCKYDSAKKKITESTTWTPPHGLTEKREAAELERQVFEFEQKVKRGHYLAGEKITLAEFVETWTKDYAERQLRPKTQLWYSKLLNGRIIPVLGHLKLAKIQPSHLIQFMNNIAEPGISQTIHYKAKPGLREKAKAAQVTAAKLGISGVTWTSALSGKRVSGNSANAISKGMKQSTASLFDSVGADRTLSTTTQSHYLRCISSLLTTAVKWQLIEYNPCHRVKAPKVIQKDVQFLEIGDSQALIAAALKESDSRIRIALLLLLYTGIRKGELAGLMWQDIDFDAGNITISRSCQYIEGKGIVTADTKTISGHRIISTSPALIKELRSHRSVMAENRLKCGDAWADSGRVITSWTGEPIHPSTIYHWIKEFLCQNNFPTMTVHGLRHTNISLLLSQGVDLITVARRAGHAKPSTTANIYAHAMRRPDEAAADKLEDILQPKAKAVE